MGGAEQIFRHGTIRCDSASARPATTIENPTSRFPEMRPFRGLETVVEAEARKCLHNHNSKTVPGLYPEGCSAGGAPAHPNFHTRCRLLAAGEGELDPTMFTKSGIMVGLGP